MAAIDIIKSRRSVRKFVGKRISRENLEKILEAGRWAPSGLNNQPWRFVIVRDLELKERLAALTKYFRTIEGADLLVVVFLNGSVVYDRTKDVQAIGACIQNMLLAAWELKIGSCWLGEIISKRKEVEKILEVPPPFELMAVIALGYPYSEHRQGLRKPLEELIYETFD